jgi:hypothetical protein
VKRIILVLLLLVVVVAGALVYLTLGKPAPRAADLLPDTTLIFFDAPNFAKSREKFRTSAAYALWQEPEVQAFLRKPLQALRGAYGGGGGDEEGNVRHALDALQGEVFLAVTHVSVLPSPQAGIVAGADVKRKRVETMAVLRNMERQLKRQHRDATFSAKNFLGVRYSIWEIRPGYPVCHAFLNSMVVFTLGEDNLRDVIARFKGQPETSAQTLAANAKYQNVVSQMPKSHEFHAYLNIEGVMGLLGPLLAFAPQAQGTFQKLARLQVSGYSATVTEGSIQEVTFTGYKSPGPQPPPVTQHNALAFTSPDTLIYSAQSADLTALYDELMQSLVQAQAFNPSLASIPVEFEQTVRQRGVRLREDVLANCGPETAFVARWPEGARYPDVALVAEIKNVSQTRPALDIALGVLKELVAGVAEQFPWEESQHSGAKLRTVRVGADRFAPTYTTTEKFLIIGINPSCVQDMLTQATGHKPTLATQPQYQRSMKRLPDKGSSYLYCDLAGLFDRLYPLAQSALAALPATEYLDAAKLPKSETIAKHLSPVVSATVSKQTGETATSFSPLGASTVLVAGGAIVAGVVAPRLFPQFNPLEASPDQPTTSSDTDARHLPRENQTAASHTATLR